MASEEKVEQAFTILGTAFPGFKVKKETIAIYMRLLSDIPDEVLEQAAMHCATTCEFFPTVAKLREAAFALASQLRNIPTAFEAWAEVLKQIGQEGYCGKPKFSHPLIHSAMLTLRGDWITLCQTLDQENIPSERARFIQAYETFARRESDYTQMLPEVREMVDRLSARRATGTDGRQLTEGDDETIN